MSSDANLAKAIDNIWIIRDLEPIPIDPGDRRLMRAGMLAQRLARRGHKARWITSSFDHYQKRQRLPQRQDIQTEENLTISVLPGPGYRHNVSLERIWHNYRFAKAFTRFAQRAPDKPDLIVTDIPTSEAAAAAIAYAKKHNIPTVLSIRDLWPDFFIDHVPPKIKPIGRLALNVLERQVKFACKHATSVVGISQSYLTWGQQKGARHNSPYDRIFPLGYEPRPHAAQTVTDDFLTQLGVKQQTKLIAFVGSWGHTYNLQLLLEAALRLADHKDIQFVIAGDGLQSKTFMPQFAELENVITPGWISAEQIAIILRRAQIGVLPYRANAPQSLPNKVFEYFAYGAYQIATMRGDAIEFYEKHDCGVSSPEYLDSGTLTEKLIQVLGSDKVSAVSKARYIERFNEHFNSDTIYNAFSDHIISLKDAEESA